MPLPDSKDAMPKCVYLDQNKWIDLARAHYGRADGEPFRETLNVVQTAVADGRIILPMSAVHIMETVAPADPARRQRLAEFIVGLSGNQTIATHMIIMKLEIRQAVLRKLGQDYTAVVRPFIVQDGLYGALDVEPQIRGVPDHIVQEVLRIAYLPETSVQILCEAVGREEVAEFRRQHEEAVIQVEEARRRAARDLTPEQKHRAELFELLTNGMPGQHLRTVLAELGVSVRDFTARFSSPEEWLEFAHSIPTLDVLVTLHLARDRELARPVHRNDFKDMAFLTVAVPYCNIVVVERYFAHLVQANGLADRYGTTVITDLNALPENLRAMNAA